MRKRKDKGVDDVEECSVKYGRTIIELGERTKK